MLEHNPRHQWKVGKRKLRGAWKRGRAPSIGSPREGVGAKDGWERSEQMKMLDEADQNELGLFVDGRKARAEKVLRKKLARAEENGGGGGM